MNLEKLGADSLEVSPEQFGQKLEDSVKSYGKEWIGFRPTNLGGVYPFYVLPENTTEIDS
jgi:hypothetical protein